MSNALFLSFSKIQILKTKGTLALAFAKNLGAESLLLRDEGGALLELPQVKDKSISGLPTATELYASKSYQSNVDKKYTLSHLEKKKEFYKDTKGAD